jgi:hypothetical protein
MDEINDVNNDTNPNNDSISEIIESIKNDVKSVKKNEFASVNQDIIPNNDSLNVKLNEDCDKTKRFVRIHSIKNNLSDNDTKENIINENKGNENKQSQFSIKNSVSKSIVIDSHKLKTIIEEIILLKNKEIKLIKDINLNNSFEECLKIHNSNNNDEIISCFIEQGKQVYDDVINDNKKLLDQKQNELNKLIENAESINDSSKPIKNNLVKNNWDNENIKTLNEWIKDCDKQQFIYDYILTKIIKKSHYIKVILIFLSALQSLVTTSNVGLDQSNYTASLALRIITMIISFLIYSFTQYITLEKFDDIIKQYTEYISNIGNFLCNIISTADMKIDLRPDGDSFIVDNRSSFVDIFNKNPYIGRNYWKEGLEEYNKYIENISNPQNCIDQKRRAYDKYVKKTGKNTDTTIQIDDTINKN